LQPEWDVLYNEYANDVNRFLLPLLRNQADVDDIRQETFIKAFRYWHTFKQSSSAKTWILSIARNLAVDLLRKKQRRQKLAAFLPIYEPEQPPLDDQMWLDERGRLLHHAIQSLPVSYRLVVILRGIQEFSSAETAQVLECSDNKVNVTYHRALKKLRKLMEEEERYHALVFK
jgi:RNA polymerase sigma-70 factor, ECF subfamily